MKRDFGWLSMLIGLLALSASGAEPAPGAAEKGASERVLVPGLTPGNENLKKLKLPANARIMIVPVNDEESTRKGMIDPWQVGFISRRLDEAARGKYDLVVLEINTLGGMVASCEQINRAIAESPVPVIAYVRGSAFSGGALISLACRAIVMESGSDIGGAQAVGEYHDLEKDQREKMRSHLVAIMRALSDKNGYPAPIAQGMVDMPATIYETDDPKHRFMSDAEMDDWKKSATTRGPPPNVIATWKKPDTILTLTSQEAYTCGLASVLATDRKALFAALGVTPAEVYDNRISGGEKISRFLGHPLFMVFLVVVAIIAAIYELKAGGHYIGYFVALLCMLLFFWLAFLGDSAGWLELSLVVTGLVLLGVEFFVCPGFGVPGIAGIAFLLLGVLSAFIPAGALPSLFQSGASANPFQKEMLVNGLTYAAIAMVSVLVLLVTAVWLGVRLPGVSLLALKTDVEVPAALLRAPGAADRPAPEVAVEAEGAGGSDENPLAKLVGLEGVAETVLRPSGKVRVAGITCDAQSEGGWIDPGARVRVLEARSFEVIVREIKQA